MGAKHTPGPWADDASLPGNVYCSDATGSIVATVNGFKFAFRPDQERLANARLIAAAPDLLAALQNASSWHERMIALYQARNLPDTAQTHVTEKGRIDAAIARAEGSE